MKLVLKPENIVQLVFFVRGEKVMFDADLAKLYGVSTKALNQAFRRNKQRFPSDFVFQLSSTEYNDLKSQIVTSSAGGTDLRSQIVTSSSHGGRRRPPYAFTEQGVAMLSRVLRSARAVEVYIAIIRTCGIPRRLLGPQRYCAHEVESNGITH